MRPKNDVAIITGAAQGIGAAFAAGFAREGAKIVIGDIVDASKTVQKVEEAGSEAIFVRTDVNNEAQCFALPKAAAEHSGKIDIFINNAAVFGSIILKPFKEISCEEYKRVVEVNTVYQEGRGPRGPGGNSALSRHG